MAIRDKCAEVLLQRVAILAGQALGSVEFGLARDTIERTRQSILGGIAGVSLVALAVFSLLMASLARTMTRPLEALVTAAREREGWDRDRWEDYEGAVADMVDRTSPSIAPWTLVEANDKRFARVKVLETVADRLEAEL